MWEVQVPPVGEWGMLVPGGPGLHGVQGEECRVQSTGGGVAGTPSTEHRVQGRAKMEETDAEEKEKIEVMGETAKTAETITWWKRETQRKKKQKKKLFCPQPMIHRW